MYRLILFLSYHVIKKGSKLLLGDPLSRIMVLV
jgi:hypothetical protein